MFASKKTRHERDSEARIFENQQQPSLAGADADALWGERRRRGEEKTEQQYTLSSKTMDSALGFNIGKIQISKMKL